MRVPYLVSLGVGYNHSHPDSPTLERVREESDPIEIDILSTSLTTGEDRVTYSTHPPCELLIFWFHTPALPAPNERLS